MIGCARLIYWDSYAWTIISPHHLWWWIILMQNLTLYKIQSHMLHLCFPYELNLCCKIMEYKIIYILKVVHYSFSLRSEFWVHICYLLTYLKNIFFPPNVRRILQTNLLSWDLVLIMWIVGDDSYFCKIHHEIKFNQYVLYFYF